MLNSAASRATLRRGLISICLAALLGTTPATADELGDASRLLKAGQHQQALERVNRVLAAKPRDAQARFLKGLIFTDQGNTREAIEIFTRLTQDYPDLPEPYNNLAVIYAAQGQYEKARSALEQSIRTHPSYATAYENLGDVYAKLASQAYDKALQLDSSNSGAKNKLSLVRDLVGGGSPAAAAAAREPAKAPVVVAQAPEKPAAKAPEKPAPVPEKPAAAPEKPTAEKAAAEQGQDASADVLKALYAWAQAWSKKDANAYLSHYASGFKTPGGQKRGEWEKVRRARIAAPKSISVDIESPKVTMRGSNEATVVFRQNYRSDILKTTSRKTLSMVKSNGRWLIQEEKSG